MKLEYVAPEIKPGDERDRRREYSPQEHAHADIEQPPDEPGSSVNSDDRNENVQAKRIHQPQGWRGNVADNRINSPHIAEDEAQEEGSAGRRQTYGDAGNR